LAPRLQEPEVSIPLDEAARNSPLDVIDAKQRESTDVC
jgi:hypothetical protein